MRKCDSGGLPLVQTSISVQRKLAAQLGPEVRFTSPCVTAARRCRNGRAIGRQWDRELLIFPQYPHYAMASWERWWYGSWRNCRARPAHPDELRPAVFLRTLTTSRPCRLVTAPYLQSRMITCFSASRTAGAPHAQGGLVPRALLGEPGMLRHLFPGPCDLLPRPGAGDDSGLGRADRDSRRSPPRSPFKSRLRARPGSSHSPISNSAGRRRRARNASWSSARPSPPIVWRPGEIAMPAGNLPRRGGVSIGKFLP